VFLYQGEELGLPEVMDMPGELRQDPMWRRSGGADVGRDGCRVPLPWNEEPSFGFSPPGATAMPWLPQPAEFAALAASRQESDPSSTLSLYRRALALRRELFAGGPTSLEWEETGRADVLAYRRGRALSVTVFGVAPYVVPDIWGSLALTSEPSPGRVLPGGSGAWIVP
jgi:alpha-glucosidase